MAAQVSTCVRRWAAIATALRKHLRVRHVTQGHFILNLLILRIEPATFRSHAQFLKDQATAAESHSLSKVTYSRENMAEMGHEWGKFPVPDGLNIWLGRLFISL